MQFTTMKARGREIRNLKNIKKWATKNGLEKINMEKDGVSRVFSPR